MNIPSSVGAVPAQPSALFNTAAATQVGEQDPRAKQSTIPPIEQGHKPEGPPLKQEQHPDQKLEEQKLVSELAARDREVRAHEQAHASVGGSLAGSPSYSYEKGPNGKSYAVGGEVSISIDVVQGDPEATIRNADTVRQAALAPAQPSSQDLAVAAQAAKVKLEASQEMRESAESEQADAASSPDELRADSTVWPGVRAGAQLGGHAGVQSDGAAAAESKRDGMPGADTSVANVHLAKYQEAGFFQDNQQASQQLYQQI